jgi:hypothetical protein
LLLLATVNRQVPATMGLGFRIDWCYFFESSPLKWLSTPCRFEVTLFRILGSLWIVVMLLKPWVNHLKGRWVMSIKRYKPEQIVTLLRQIEVEIANSNHPANLQGSRGHRSSLLSLQN